MGKPARGYSWNDVLSLSDLRPTAAIVARAAFRDVPPLRSATRATIVIPAHNEAEYIGRTLAALIAQRSLDGSAFDPAAFDVLVYANTCADPTAEIVRAFAAQHPAYAVFVAEESLPPSLAHIGTARGAVMDAASARFTARGDMTLTSVIVSTDADTLPASQWLAWTLREMESVDAVMGRILFDRREWAALPAHTRRALCEENAYHFTLTHLTAQLSPTPYDPWPRHWQRWGPSFAVRAHAYDAVGGVPRVRVLEDIALYDALAASGARIRHSLRVRVTTSARLDPRAVGGFGTRIGEWNALNETALHVLVEHPDDTLERLRGTATHAKRAPRPRVPAAEAMVALRLAIK